MEVPVAAQNLLQQSVVAAAGVALESLVGTHHLLDMGFLYQVLEGRQVGLPQIALRQVFYIKVVAGLLRTAMHGEVFGAGQQLAVFSVVGSLQTAHHTDAHLTVHEGVLAVTLLAAAPARVAEDVDGRCPERQGLVAFDGLALSALQRVLGAGLVAHGTIDTLDEVVVERTGHANARRENSRQTVAPHTVEGLAPPVELTDTQSRNGRRAVHHQLALLFQRQTA